MHTELQDVMGQSFGVPDDIDEDDLMGELDALEDELAQEAENPTANGVPSYLQVRHNSIMALNVSTVGTTVSLRKPPGCMGIVRAECSKSHGCSSSLRCSACNCWRNSDLL